MRIGVYVCHCGINISHRVDVTAVARFAERRHDVVVARDYRCEDILHREVYGKMKRR